jgi:sirohydrochlorin ferrochelatase
MKDAVPVLVGCSHGTDSADGRASVRGLLAGVRAARPDLDVREAFVDVQQPRVGDVVRHAVAGAGAAVVVPLLLSVGYHVRVDISAAAAGPASVAATPLGPDTRLVRILLDRLHAAGAEPHDAIVLAAAGSTDSQGTATVLHVAEALRSAWGGDPVTVGFGAGAFPRVPEAVAAARATGAGRVVLASYHLAPGYFHDRLHLAGADIVTGPLAPDERLVEIVIDRYEAAARRTVPG